MGVMVTASLPVRLRIAAFDQPGQGFPGGRFFYGPGIENFDMALQKNLPITESKYFQFRLEAFNVFNQVQFTGVNSSFVFNAQGVNTNTNIGALTGERGPRVVALELRAQF